MAKVIKKWLRVILLGPFVLLLMLAGRWKKPFIIRDHEGLIVSRHRTLAQAERKMARKSPKGEDHWTVDVTID